MLDFKKKKTLDEGHPKADGMLERNSTSAAGSGFKKARVEGLYPSSKVKKERIGDRITALHQLVSPFGKTDTASVLLEAIGYIRFLRGQIQALSSPYLGRVPTRSTKNLGERGSIFPEEPGQLLNDAGMDERLVSESKGDEKELKDLRSRGLCLVPISHTLQMESNQNGADFWGGSFR